VCCSIFLNVKGFQPVGSLSPGDSLENIPTSVTGEDWEEATEKKARRGNIRTEDRAKITIR
jgi:hypothetical protein